jgi:hypothetical protein
MTTESRERADGFYQCELENKHVYDCQLCENYHIVDDDTDAFICPIAELKGEPPAIMFHPNE